MCANSFEGLGRSFLATSASVEPASNWPFLRALRAATESLPEPTKVARQQAPGSKPLTLRLAFNPSAQGSTGC